MFPPVYTEDFPLLSSNVMIYVILGAMKYLCLSLFDNTFMHWSISLIGEKISPESIISCWNMIILP